MGTLNRATRIGKQIHTSKPVPQKTARGVEKSFKQTDAEVRKIEPETKRYDVPYQPYTLDGSSLEELLSMLAETSFGEQYKTSNDTGTEQTAASVSAGTTYAGLSTTVDTKPLYTSTSDATDAYTYASKSTPYSKSPVDADPMNQLSRLENLVLTTRYIMTYLANAFELLRERYNELDNDEAMKTDPFNYRESRNKLDKYYKQLTTIMLRIDSYSIHTVISILSDMGLYVPEKVDVSPEPARYVDILEDIMKGPFDPLRGAATTK